MYKNIILYKIVGHGLRLERACRPAGHHYYDCDDFQTSIYLIFNHTQKPFKTFIPALSTSSKQIIDVITLYDNTLYTHINAT